MATGGVSDMDRGTDETFDFLCSICKAKNRNTEGDQFCEDCHDYYCSTCVKFHDDVPVLKTHKILNKAQFQPLPGTQFPQVPTERCREHTHKPVDMYCKQHDTVICSICMVAHHSACNEKFYIPDYIKNNKDIDNTNIAGQIDTIVNSLAELKDTLTKDKEILETGKEKSLEQIQMYRQEINLLLDKLEKKTINDLEQRFQSLKNNIEAILRELQDTLSSLQTCQNSLKSTFGNMAQMFVSIKIANEAAFHAHEKVNTTKSQYSSPTIAFMPNQQLHTLLNNIHTLGDISRTEMHTPKRTTDESMPQVTPTHDKGESCESHFKPTVHESLPQETKIYTSNSSYSSQVTKSQTDNLQESSVTTGQSRDKFSVRLYTSSILQVKAKRRYRVDMKSDSRTCYIKSACKLSDGTIILADRENNKLKRMNRTSYITKQYCDVPKSPWQVCAIAEQEVAVSCGRSSLIQFVSIRRTMQRTRQINTGFPCYALAYADGKLFVSDDSSVYVYSVSGRRQQQFSRDQSKQIFSNIYSLSVSSDNSKIYVADNNRGLIILDRTGQVIEQFNGPELKGASGVCLYNNDGVLVCGYDSKNVLQFSPEGKLLGEVLKSVRCRAVCRGNHNLIVGLYDDNDIEVYDINCDGK